MNNQTRTVQEFLNKHRMEGINGKYLPKNVEYLLVKFARLHVEAALQAAAEKIKTDAIRDFGTDVPDCWSVDSILNAYPLENIK
jgi:hypothetical protein